MMDYVHELSVYQGSRYDNSYIGRISFARWGEETAETAWKTEIVKPGSEVECLQVQAWNGPRMTGILEAWIFFAGFPRQAPSRARHEGYQGRLWRSFSKEEVEDFARATGDFNPIHLTETPVVQGLLIFLELGRTLGYPDFLSVKFRSPVHAGIPIYLKEEHIDEPGKHFTHYCSRSFQRCLPNPYDDEHCCLCRAFSSVGLHFFSAAFHTRHGDGADHRRESGRLHHEA